MCPVLTKFFVQDDEVEEYERATRYNYSSAEKFALVEVRCFMSSERLLWHHLLSGDLHDQRTAGAHGGHGKSPFRWHKVSILLLSNLEKICRCLHCVTISPDAVSSPSYRTLSRKTFVR